MNPYALIGTAVLWALSLWYTYDKGGDHRENAMVAEAAEIRNKALKDHADAQANWQLKKAALATQRDDALGKLQEVAATPVTTVVYKTRTINEQCSCVDASIGPDWLRVWNDAATAADSAVPRDADRRDDAVSSDVQDPPGSD